MSIQILLVISAIATGVATDANGKVIEMTDAEVTPIEKVIIMLEDLQTEVVTEGKAEAKTYDKFACFCKDMTKEKVDAIKSGQDEQETLTADIEELTAKRDKLDEKIAELESKIEEIEGEMKESADERASTLKVFEANAADMKSALNALDKAIAVLKGSRPSSFLQIQGMANTLRRATYLADALGIGSPKAIKAVNALLQQPGVPMEDYSFHSEEVISLLEELKVDFTNTLNDLDAEEVKSVAAHMSFMQSKTSEKKDAELSLTKAKKAKDDTVAEIAEKSGQLTTVSATLLDDQAFLMELAKVCQAQAKTWDQRSNMRADELAALTEAISIIKGTVTAKSGKVIRFTQDKISLGKVLAVAADDDDMQSIEEEAEAADGDVSFVQLTQPRLLLSAVAHSATAAQSALASAAQPEEDSKREQVLSLLKTESKKLNSKLLSQLAVQVAADPFAKLKVLIQELIQRLMQEAADEANHKGWCDKEMSAAKQDRDHNADDIVEFNDRLAINEALRDKLAEEIDVLEKEIKDLTEELAKATKMRADEKAENLATIKEAEEGKDAVEMAIDVLSKFYNKAKDAKVEFAQQPDLGAPDSGFESGEAYKGKGSESGGILGMLDVILSDFKRTIKVTTEEEAKAAQEFMEFERDTKMSITTKKASLDSKSTELEKVLSAIADDMSAMIAAQEMLDQAIKELLELHEACVDTGMSYAERAALREQEIESLKKALCILDKMGPVQTEGC